MTYRRFSVAAIACMAVFVAFNAVVWHAATGRLLDQKGGLVDAGLARMAYLPDSRHERVRSDTLPRRHVAFKDYSGGAVDVVTLGDSFSANKNGENGYYQDWLATLQGKTVLNVPRYRDRNPLQTAYMLLDTGILERIRPAYFLVECVERDVVPVFGSAVDVAMTHDDPASFEDELRERTKGTPRGERSASFISVANVKYLMNRMLFRFSDHAFFSDVHSLVLDRDAFTVQDSRRLLFFRDDIHRLKLATPKAADAVNDTLNKLARRLGKLGITLVFMPAVDKYDLYREFIVANRYPPNKFFELLRPLPKDYLFIDTKAILLPELRKGVKDLYYADDTHWSWKGAKRIFEEFVLDRERDLMRRNASPAGS